VLQAVENRVWQRVIPSSDLTAAQQQHLISSTARRSDGVHLRVVGEKPTGPDVESRTPTLEDAYLCHLSSADGPKSGNGSQ
jgi:ABC-2 type transport system ATP-binding protein